MLDHKFGVGDPYTLGVEEEYQLLDCETFDLVQHIETMLEAVTGHELEARINAELMQSVIEISTPVCRNAGDVMRWLTKLRGYVTEIASERGTARRLRGDAPVQPLRVASESRPRTATGHLSTSSSTSRVASSIFGMHVHVAVDDPEKAIKVVNGLLPHLAPLLALSASSPFWRGEPTGLASSRQMVFSAFPRSGPPPRFRDYADYAEVVGPARALRLHRRLHPHLVGHPSPSSPRHDRDPDLRRRHARRGRGRDRRVLPGARQAALGALRGRRGDPVVPPDPHE